MCFLYAVMKIMQSLTNLHWHFSVLSIKKEMNWFLKFSSVVMLPLLITMALFKAQVLLLFAFASKTPAVQ